MPTAWAPRLTAGRGKAAQIATFGIGYCWGSAEHMSLSRQEVEASVRAVPFWWHSIDVGQGVISPGEQTPEVLRARLESLQLPDLHGKTVLDIGAYDGFYSFQAERLGATRVVALDHYVWSLDLAEHIKYWRDCRERGLVPEPYHTTPHWRPTEMPGKAGYDTAHRLLESRVETVVADFMTCDLSALGRFDVVLFLGVLYHLESPLEALRRVFSVTTDLAIIETASVMVPGYEQTPLFEFYGSNELNADVSNWWAPNQAGLSALCRAAGFRRVDVLTPRPGRSGWTRLKSMPRQLLSEIGFVPPRLSQLQHVRYRTIVHAWKSDASA
jgi:tRNA (mo5U34)-methyltransferase